MSDLMKGLLIAGGVFIAYKAVNAYSDSQKKQVPFNNQQGDKRPAPQYDPGNGNARAPQKGDTNWQDVAKQGVVTLGGLVGDAIKAYQTSDDNNAQDDGYSSESTWT